MSEKIKLLKGKVTISRVHMSNSQDYISISLIDELSGCECCDIQIPVETFGALVTGLSRQDCEFEWRPQNVGKVVEHKTMIIPCVPSEWGYRVTEEVARKILKPYETDGWMGSWRDLGNMHRRSGDGFSVGFVRFVDVE